MSARYRADQAGARRRVVLQDGVEGFHLTFTRECRGCCELGEYAGLAHRYDFDAKASCYIGSGCHECGYTGKRRDVLWVPFSYEEMPHVR